MGAITRVRTGCWTCKKRHRKCDEGKPSCNNCIKAKRVCEGYDLRISFDVDDPRNNSRLDSRGNIRYSFVGRPRAFKSSKSIEKALKDSGLKVHQLPKKSTTIINSRIPSSNIQNIKSYSSESFVNSTLEPMPLNQSVDFSSSSSKVVSRLSNNEISGSIIDKDQTLTVHPKIPGIDLELYGSEIYEVLEYLFKSPVTLSENKNSCFPQTRPSLILKNKLSDLNSEDRTIENTSSYETVVIQNNCDDEAKLGTNFNTIDADSSLTYEEENRMLRHFFQILLPLLDAHPNSPWPNLALEYCDFEIARSCFISLACIHMYESKIGGAEFYQKGIVHFKKTLDYLMEFISSTADNNDSTINIESKKKKQMMSSFVILVLINVHVLFAVLDKGLSSFARCFFKTFASVCQDSEFYKSLLENEKKQSLVVVLSWYDTVSALVSPDCRLPFCKPDWYGSTETSTSTAKMMGCPSAVFKVLAKICIIRHELYEQGVAQTRAKHLIDYEEIKQELLNYREAVEFGDEYNIRLKAAQCWSLAAYLTLIKTIKPSESYLTSMSAILHEFIDVYDTIPERHSVRTQMVWPLFVMGCECQTIYEKKKLTDYMNTLYSIAQMGTLDTLRNIVFQIWNNKGTSEKIIQQWLNEGIDYLPL